MNDQLNVKRPTTEQVNKLIDELLEKKGNKEFEATYYITSLLSCSRVDGPKTKYSVTINGKQVYSQGNFCNFNRLSSLTYLEVALRG